MNLSENRVKDKHVIVDVRLPRHCELRFRCCGVGNSSRKRVFLSRLSFCHLMVAGREFGAGQQPEQMLLADGMECTTSEGGDALHSDCEHCTLNTVRGKGRCSFLASIIYGFVVMYHLLFLIPYPPPPTNHATPTTARVISYTSHTAKVQTRITGSYRSPLELFPASSNLGGPLVAFGSYSDWDHWVAQTQDRACQHAGLGLGPLGFVAVVKNQVQLSSTNSAAATPKTVKPQTPPSHPPQP